ncbi:TonB family protein [Methylocapsa acidiphila]|uniref:energy transducer TonB family protein n=1 Tax=Methylocapsa acidiphila TaxID=133552 RepID=UPI0003FB4B96
MAMPIQIAKFISCGFCAALLYCVGASAFAASSDAPAPSRPAAEVVQTWRNAVRTKILRIRVTPRNGISDNGAVVVGFWIDRRGNITGEHVIRSSGAPALDKSALAMILLASPVPPPPEGISGNQFHFVAPISFHAQ